MNVATSFSLESEPAAAVAAACARLQEALGGAPHWVLAQAAVGHDAEALRAALAQHLSGVAVHGGSSCLGVMTQAGMHSDGSVGLGLLGIRDAEGGFGTGAAASGGDARAAAREAVSRAIEAAGRPGETPALIWLSSAPGSEEAVLEGIADVVGRGVPVVGGSTADSTVEGLWFQLTAEAVFHDAVVVSALFPSTRMVSALQSGYAPTSKRGRVTRALGRTIFEIDGAPAAAQYSAWTGGSLEEVIAAGGGNILARTTLAPLGRQVGEAGGVPCYLLAHPDSVTASGALTLFADVAEGEEVVLMVGSTEGLVARAGRVARDVLADGDLGPEGAAGALVVFCAGCMLAVRERMPEVVAGLNAALSGAPFLGCFTFGEQGSFVGGESCHGNLMISVTALARG